MYDDELDTHDLTRTNSEAPTSDVALTTQFGFQQTIVPDGIPGGRHCIDEADRC